ncbi:MAG: type II secretion system GspH family protein [Heliobacteriaceae bacterium]|jgi:type II secretory pathway pseudopilin PulG|nr:type II secretion system GspH family protein [Heliobacteriaceae bacterium]
MKKTAFTLAEVVITVGIIGIVAALTMPSLITKYREKELVVQTKKAYSIISQAFLMMRNESEMPNTDNIIDALAPYIKIAKNCGRQADLGCFAQNSSYQNGTPSKIDSRTDISKIVLADGMSVSFQINDVDCKDSVSHGTVKNICGWMLIDANGTRKPNQYGVDTFEILILSDRILPYGTQDDAISFPERCNKNTAGGGNGCAAWVIINENLDYLHCDDLSWNGKTKCK